MTHQREAGKALGVEGGVVFSFHAQISALQRHQGLAASFLQGKELPGRAAAGGPEVSDPRMEAPGSWAPGEGTGPRY